MRGSVVLSLRLLLTRVVNRNNSHEDHRSQVDSRSKSYGSKHAASCRSKHKDCCTRTADSHREYRKTPQSQLIELLKFFAEFA